METETACYRSTETRHGGAVRWFVERQASRRRVSQQAASTEQPELWPVERNDVTAAEEVMAATASEPIPLVEDVSFMPLVEKETLSRPRRISRRFVAPIRSVAPVAGLVASRPRFASFLQATGAVENMQSGEDIRFALPGRSLSKMLRLWKGTESSAACAPVYF